jgi:hypothetical protein
MLHRERIGILAHLGDPEVGFPPIVEVQEGPDDNDGERRDGDGDGEPFEP